MGCCLSPFLADVFMDNLENTYLDIQLWLIYLDQIFVVLDGDFLNTTNNFLASINNLHPFINFTLELEQNHKINFLDLIVKYQDFKSFAYRIS